MKKIINLVLMLSAIICLISCEGPEANFPETNLLDIIHENITAFNSKDTTISAENDFKNWKTWHKLIAFKKDSEINIASRAPAALDNILFYSSDNNKFIIAKPVYMTYLKDDLCFSLDNITWYFVKNNIATKEFSINSKKEGNKLLIEYMMAFNKKDNAPVVEIPAGREIITLKKDMILNSAKKNTKHSTLKKKIILLSKNTSITPGVNISGNIINFRSENGNFILSAVKSIYIYIKEQTPVISFDKIEWSLSLFSFDVKSELTVTAVEDDHIIFDLSGTLLYEDGTFNLSLFKLLI